MPVDHNSLVTVIVGLLLAFLAIGAGKGLSPFVKPAFKKMFNLYIDQPEVNPMAPPFEPSKYCPAYQAEHERSLRNEASIKELWADFMKLSETIKNGLAELQKTQTEGISQLHDVQIKILLGLVQGGVLDAKTINDVLPKKP